MNDYIDFLKDSIITSVSMKIFKNIEDASVAHIFKSMLVKLPLSLFTDVDNFNPDRLKKKAINCYKVCFSNIVHDIYIYICIYIWEGFVVLLK